MKKTIVVTAPMRRKAFRAALVTQGTDLQAWCKDNGKGYHHVGLVVNGKRVSKSFDLEVDSYIVRTLFPFVDDYRKRMKDSEAV